MQRAIRTFCLITVSSFLIGCSPEGEANKVAPATPEVAKDAAAKMPPPPGTKAK